MYEKILVPLDGSKTAETILPNVLRLALESEARVVLFSVETSVPNAGKGHSSWSDLGNGLATIEKPDAQMKAYLDSTASMLSALGVDALTASADGDQQVVGPLPAVKGPAVDCLELAAVLELGAKGELGSTTTV